MRNMDTGPDSMGSNSKLNDIPFVIGQKIHCSSEDCNRSFVISDENMRYSLNHEFDGMSFDEKGFCLQFSVDGAQWLQRPNGKFYCPDHWCIDHDEWFVLDSSHRILV